MDLPGRCSGPRRRRRRDYRPVDEEDRIRSVGRRSERPSGAYLRSHLVCHPWCDASRAVGFGLLGMATGIAMGLVESALKDRWLYVTTGPLAGKNSFFTSRRLLWAVRKAATFISSRILRSCRSTLFWSSKVRIDFIVRGTAYVGGQPVRGIRVLENGVLIQLGRTAFVPGEAALMGGGSDHTAAGIGAGR